MSRKHENFSYYYGIKCAPEQWKFYYNGTLIPLECEKTSTLAQLCIAGRKREAEDMLKRMLRAEEKRGSIAGKCIAFFKKGSDEEYYFTQQLMYNPNNIQSALYSYKEWKRYIKKQDCQLTVGYELTTGEFVPGGENKGVRKQVRETVDLSRLHSVTIVRNDLMFIK